MLVQAIPAYRLPREELGREISMIESMGVTIKTGKALGKDFTLAGLQGRRATTRCSSAWAPRPASAWASPAKRARA